MGGRPRTSTLYWLLMTIPQTGPAPPTAEPEREPGQSPEAPQPEPRRGLDPFDPPWPSTRPTPRPKATA